jgi:serine/threonine protein kinase
MELLDGDTLHQRLTHGRLDLPALVEIGLALADALASAHAKGIVHRDLKPSNIILTTRGPKILDFGLARITDTAARPYLRRRQKVPSGSASDGWATISPSLRQPPADLH